MRTVMIFGTFDILHAGHINMFTQAKKYGDTLIAVVSQDKRTASIKGKKPFHTHEERKIMLSEIKTIDTVISGDTEDVYKVIQNEKPDVIALGYDQTIFIDNLAEKIKGFGIDTEIVRLNSYKPQTKKTSKIKEYLLNSV